MHKRFRSILAGLIAFALLSAVLPRPGACLETVVSKYKMKLYGFVKADAIYTNHAMSSLDYRTWVTSAGLT